jgi:hypothetical protein
LGLEVPRDPAGWLHHTLAALGADVVVRRASVRQPDSALMDARWAFISASMHVKIFCTRWLPPHGLGRGALLAFSRSFDFSSR